MAHTIAQALGLPSVDLTFGAVFLCILLGLLVYGLTVYQAYRYYTMYMKDRLRIKIFITVILAFETFHTALWIAISYHYCITEAFNIVGLLAAHWTIRLNVLATSLTTYTCQLFYVHRVYRFGPGCYRWLAIPALVTMTTGLCIAIVTTVKTFTSIRYISDFQPRFGWMVSVSYGFAVSSDFLLTGTLVFLFRRSRVGSKRSDTVLAILTKYTINTGLLTSVFSALVFIFAIALPGNLVYVGFSILSAKLYASSVLAVVNSRKSIGNKFLDDLSTCSVPSARGRADAVTEGSMVWSVCLPPIRTVSESIRTTDEPGGVKKPETSPVLEQQPKPTATV